MPRPAPARRCEGRPRRRRRRPRCRARGRRGGRARLRSSRAAWVDSGAYPSRHREVGGSDERLDFEQHGRVPSMAQVTAAPISPEPRCRRERRGRARRRGRRRSSRTRRARWSSRSGSLSHAGCGARGSGRPRTGGRSRRGARGLAGRRPRRPWSRGRRGSWRRRPPSRRAAAAPPLRGPGRPTRSRAMSAAYSVCTESITQTSGRSRSSVAHTASSSVSARISTCSEPPSRAARSFTCATDSSPVTSSARRPRGDRSERREEQRRLADAGLAADEDEPRRHEAAAEDSVELVMPVEIRFASSACTSTRRRSGRAAGCAPPRVPPATRVPNAPQPGHLPSHRPASFRTPCTRTELPPWPWSRG